MSSTHLNDVDAFFKEYHDKNVQIILFFSRSKTDRIHGIFKTMELKYNMVTQHILQSVVEKGLTGTGSLVFDNILMKFNEKLGGINYDLAITNAFIKNNSCFGSEGYILCFFINIFIFSSRDWFNPSRMFIGLDMSHAAAQSVYEKQTDTPVSEPTVIGVIGYLIF